MHDFIALELNEDFYEAYLVQQTRGKQAKIRACKSLKIRTIE